jgi:hypothetical protein
MSFWNGKEWVAEAPPAPELKPEGRAKHVAKALLEASLITALTFGMIAGTAFAGKPTGGSGTIVLAPLVVDVDGNGLPNHGDIVTFTISTTASAPFVNLVCTQDGVVVLNGSHGYFDGSLDTSRNFGLDSGSWQSGSAQCTAYIQVQTRKGWSRLASTSFSVEA